MPYGHTVMDDCPRLEHIKWHGTTTCVYVKTSQEFVFLRAPPYFTMIQIHLIIHLQDLYVPEQFRTGLAQIGM